VDRFLCNIWGNSPERGFLNAILFWGMALPVSGNSIGGDFAKEEKT
jgi:hypothetical protein